MSHTAMHVTKAIAPWRDILGYPVANLGYDEGLRLLAKRLEDHSYTPITFLNAHNANVAKVDKNFSAALNDFLILADGIGVDVASYAFHGSAFKANLNGTDLVPALFSFCTKRLKVGLLGARPHVITQARDAFAQETPWHDFQIISDGFFQEKDLPDIKARLAIFKPDVLLVAMGVPRQEEFIANNLGPEYCTMPMAIGALLDIHTGTIPRAPLWVRRLRCEWAYRLVQEPKRLWYRYIIGNPLFLLNVMRSYMSGKSRDSGAPHTISS